MAHGVVLLQILTQTVTTAATAAVIHIVCSLFRALCPGLSMENIIKAPESSRSGSPISPFYWGNKGWHWEGSNLRKDSFSPSKPKHFQPCVRQVGEWVFGGGTVDCVSYPGSRI